MKKNNYYKKITIIFLIFIVMSLISTNLLYATSDNTYNVSQCDLKNNSTNVICNNKQNYKLKKCNHTNSQCNNINCQNYNCNKNVLKNNNNKKTYLNKQCSNCLRNNINKR